MSTRSRVTYTANGIQTDFSIPFNYLSTTHLVVEVDGVPTTAYSLVGSTTVRFDVAPADTAEVLIYRQTPADERLVDYQGGSTLTEKTMDLDSNQLFYIIQEAFDTAEIGSELEGLTDVDVANQTAGYYLVWNGTKHVYQKLPDSYVIQIDDAPEGTPINEVLGAGINWSDLGVSVSDQTQVAYAGSSVFVALYEDSGTLYSIRSIDNGETWSTPTAITLVGTETAPDPFGIVSLGSGILIAGINGDSTGDTQLIRSTDYGATWSSVFVKPTTNGLSAATFSVYYAASGRVFASGTSATGDRTWVSDDSGATWYESIYPINGNTANQSVGFDNSLFGVGYDGSTLWYSSDGGENWTQYSPTVNPGNIRAVARDGSKYAIIDNAGEIRYTSDVNGGSWATVYTGDARGLVPLGSGRWMWVDITAETINFTNDDFATTGTIGTPFGILSVGPSNSYQSHLDFSETGIGIMAYQSTIDSNWYLARSIPIGA